MTDWTAAAHCSTHAVRHVAVIVVHYCDLEDGRVLREQALLLMYSITSSSPPFHHLHPVCPPARWGAVLVVRYRYLTSCVPPSLSASLYNHVYDPPVLVVVRPHLAYTIAIAFQ